MGEQHTRAREELYALVWTAPMMKLAQTFGLSDVGLAKVCKRHDIPRPEPGYWQRLAAGQPVKQPPLPMAPSGVGETITFGGTDQFMLSNETTGLDSEVMEWIEREALTENRITVPERVTRFHPLVQPTMLAFKSLPIFGNAPCWAGGRTLSLKTSRQSLPSVCRLLHALVTALELRGFTVGPREDVRCGTTVRLLGEEISFQIEERKDRRSHVLTAEERQSTQRLYPPPIPKYDHIGNGRFRLTVETFYIRKYFWDTPGRPLRDRLNEAIVAMVRLAIEVHRPERLKREEEERQRVERARRLEIFVRRRDLFECAFKSWSERQERLRFLEDLDRTFSTVASEMPDRAKDYVAWARRYVERGDAIGSMRTSLKKNANAEFYRFEQETLSPWRNW